LWAEVQAVGLNADRREGRDHTGHRIQIAGIVRQIAACTLKHKLWEALCSALSHAGV
jgi:hypothetical protein